MVSLERFCNLMDYARPNLIGKMKGRMKMFLMSVSSFLLGTVMAAVRYYKGIARLND